MTPLTKPELLAQLDSLRQFTGEVLANPCSHCKHGVRVDKRLDCGPSPGRKPLQCLNDPDEPTFEMIEEKPA